MQTFTVKRPAERILLGFGFTKRLSTGETITSVDFQCSTLDGVDASAGSMVSGVPQINGGDVRSWVSYGVAGCTYLISAIVTTSTGRILEATAAVPVVA